ncbi:hypothetical protein QBC37DRAFT_379320 [Rhypophila decipiens]|uniref:Uncharacterized protein n=1 Tax=Rhypophila decipiens TaxID=261697 RepID=A0AAN6XX18_9PEZI|nr:hypothetical protein QBC37DRAFT_379320 [Rhypophila decipiens]
MDHINSSSRADPFADLPDAHIAEYSALIRQEENESLLQNHQNHQIHHGQGGHNSISHLIHDPDFEAIRHQRADQTAAIPGNPIKDPKGAQSFANQPRIEPVMRSVVRPLSNTWSITNNLLPDEETLHRFRVGTKVDGDCDQLRAMVKIFLTAPQRPFPGDKLYDEKDAPLGLEFEDESLGEHVGGVNEVIRQEAQVTAPARVVCDDEGDAGNAHVGLAGDDDAAEVNDGPAEHEELESDEFHDARETPGQDLGSDFQSAAGETTEHSPGASAAPSEEDESEAEAASEAEEGDSEADGNQGLDDPVEFEDPDQLVHIAPCPLRKNKRGQTTDVEESPEPAAPAQKRPRSGRAL